MPLYIVDYTAREADAFHTAGANYLRGALVVEAADAAEARAEAIELAHAGANLAHVEPHAVESFSDRHYYRDPERASAGAVDVPRVLCFDCVAAWRENRLGAALRVMSDAPADAPCDSCDACAFGGEHAEQNGRCVACGTRAING